MDPADFIVDPSRFSLPWSGVPMPLALVDLDRTASEAAVIELPPFPVIGLGDAGHPLAGRLDAVIEPPVGIGSLLRSVTASPGAAAVLVQTLRMIDAMPMHDALMVESLAYGVLQAGAEHRAWLARRAARDPAEPGRVVVERRDEVLSIVLDRPGAGNAIDVPMRDGLHEAFTLAALDPSIARIDLTARGKAFSLGAELAEFGTTRDPARAHAIRVATLPATMLARCAERVAVRLQGACIGAGLEMAAFAREIIAERRAWFQLPELAMGLIPGAGGCVSLCRRIGRQRTALLVLSGRRIGTLVAQDWGLVDRVVDE